MNDKRVAEGSALKNSNSPEIKKNKTPMKKRQKIFVRIAIIVSLILMSGAVTFFVLRARGESKLKTEEKYTIYNGERYKYRKDVINILCLGIDKDIPIQYIEERRGNIGMSDAIMLVSIDTKRHKVKVIAIPRDTMTEIQTRSLEEAENSGWKKERRQICMQYAYGLSPEESNELTVNAVSKLLYDTPIQRCCAINTEVIPVLNDAIGGVDVEILEDIEEWEPRLKYGEKIHLEGELAFRFVNVRNKHRPDGGVLRTQRQKQYALAFVEKAKSVIRKKPSLPVSMFQELQKSGSMCTNITLEDIAYLTGEIMGVSFSEDIIQVIPGESTVGEKDFVEFSMDVDAVKKMIINTFYEKI